VCVVEGQVLGRQQRGIKEGCTCRSFFCVCFCVCFLEDNPREEGHAFGCEKKGGGEGAARARANTDTWARASVWNRSPSWAAAGREVEVFFCIVGYI
jgi:hypothetical protein